MQITQIAKSYVATSVFLLPTTRRLGNGSIVVARLAMVNKERRRNKHRPMMWWLLRETCACDVVIVLASATKQANILQERARAVWSHADNSFLRAYTGETVYSSKSGMLRFSFSTSTVAGAVNAGGVRLPALSLVFLSVVNKVQFQQCCQGYQRLSTREEGKGGVRRRGGKWRSHPQGYMAV